jgi:hypothetical protein
MKRAALETAAALAASVWIPGAVDGWFVKNLIALPSWPYGVSLAVFAFCSIKTFLVFLRPAVHAAEGGRVPVAERAA